MFVFNAVSQWVTRLPIFCNWVHCVCLGPWPFSLTFLSVLLSLFWSGRSFIALIIRSVKTCTLGPPRPLSPSVPVEAGCLLVRAAAWAPVCLNSDSGESLHCFLVDVNKSYVIATSDLWLCIYASNLLPSLPTPLPHIFYAISETHGHNY